MRAFLLFLFILLILPVVLLAQNIDQHQTQTGKPHTNKSAGMKKPAPVNRQSQKQQQQQAQYQKAISSSASTVGDQANSQNINFDAGPAPIVLIPQGHTANCLRTYGLSFGNKDAGGGVGWPYRDKDCDYDNEAADAFSAGQWRIGWYWNCHKKSSYKAFKRPGSSKQQQIQACHQRMMSMYVQEPVISPPQCCTNNCDHEETHERIFAKCMEK